MSATVRAGASAAATVDPMSTLLVVMTWPVAAAVGASRVYLGYHSLAQVLVGSAGLYKLNAVDPQLESAWFQQPLRTYEVKTRFQAFAFKCNLYRYSSVVGVAFGCVWHLLCCACARAFENGDSGGVVGRVAGLMGMRDSSLVADPLAVERKALRDAAAKHATKKTK